MAANPNPVRPALSLVPVRAFNPIAPAIVWPPLEGDAEHCAACGRPLNSHDVLTRGGMRAHLLNQDKHGFRAGKRVVHYSPAQRNAKKAEELAEEKRTAGKNALLSVYEAAPRDLQWLVTLATIDYDAGDYAACGSSLWLVFRLEARDAARDERARAEREDYLDSVEMQRPVA